MQISSMTKDVSKIKDDNEAMKHEVIEMAKNSCCIYEGIGTGIGIYMRLYIIYGLRSSAKSRNKEPARPTPDFVAGLKLFCFGIKSFHHCIYLIAYQFFFMIRSILYHRDIVLFDLIELERWNTLSKVYLIAVIVVQRDLLIHFIH